MYSCDTCNAATCTMPYHWNTLGTESGMRQQGGKELKQMRAAWESIGKSVVAAEAEAERS